MGRLICDNISEIISDIVADYEKGRPIDKQDIFGQPNRDAVKEIIYKMNHIVYAGYYVDRTYKIYNLSTTIASVTEDVAYNLNKQIALALHFDKRLEGKSEEEIRTVAEDYTVQFMKKIPEIREYLDTDIEALFVGDPAAESKDAIILAYPGLFAISVQRYAHVLYQLGIPMLPRVMTEIAHSKTGITIGKYFFIDHGTGVVVGEPTVIGENVKIYQGVTLGALSTRGGRGLIDKKRHPTIEDNVTIYSGASILGGDTVIGEGSVIGGNVFLTKSVPPHTKVHVANQELKFDGDAFTKQAEDENWFYVI